MQLESRGTHTEEQLCLQLKHSEAQQNHPKNVCSPGGVYAVCHPSAKTLQTISEAK